MPVYFTIQPGAPYVKDLAPGSGTYGARLIYPNYLNLPPGTSMDFWHYDPEDKGWYVYGQGKVTPDARQVVPDPGVSLYEFTGAMSYYGGYVPPPKSPTPGGCAEAGDPVDCSTGLLVYRKTDLTLPGPLPLALTRVYESGDSVLREMGVGFTHSYDLRLWSAQPYTEADLFLPDRARIHYDRISACVSSCAVDYQNAVYEHAATPGAFYKSRITWNQDGWLLRLKDGTLYKFGIDTRLVYVRDRFGNTVNVADIGNVRRISSPDGRWIELSETESWGGVSQARDSSGRVVSYAYDGDNRLIRVTDAGGGLTEYTYDVNGRMLAVKDARQITYLANEYDAAGRVSRQTLADTGAFQFSYSLGAQGRVKQTDITDPRSNLRRMTFNAEGHLLTDARLAGGQEQKTTLSRERNTNLITRVTDPLGRKTDYAYDACGNVTSVTRLAGTQQAVATSFTYQTAAECATTGSFNLVTSVTDPLNHATTFAYDSQGRLTSLTDPLSHQTTFTYNAAGQPTSLTDPLLKSWQFGYTSGLLSSMTDPLGRTTTRVNDAAGRLASLTNPLGQATYYDYDPLNRLTRLTDPLLGATEFSYDPNGNLLSVRDARGGETTYSYEAMDRLQTRIDPLLKAESYEYDLTGNLMRFTGRQQQATSFTYDGFDRLAQASYADGSTTAYTYDLGNRLTQVVDSLSGTIALTYDGLDRLTQEVTPQGTVSYTYDAAGRRTSMTVAGQPTASYTYDNAGRLAQITQGTQTVSIGYDAADRRTSLTLPNGVLVEYGYGDAGQLTRIDYKQGNTLIGDLTYQYDAAGNRVAAGGSFGRTGLPQPLASAVYDAANRLTQWGATTLTYDDNGNLTSDGTNTYAWDARNRLASMTGASFQYDPFGRRTSKTIGGATTSYLYDGINVVQETGAAAANLLTGLGVDEIFTRTDAGGARHFLTDALGSTLALLDGAGAAQTQYLYEPFGRVTVTGAPSSNPFQYTGRENDATGLYYYRARYYHPGSQRFIGEDPIGLRGGDVNLHAYVRNSPLDFTDPFGLEKTGAAAGGFLGFGGGLLYAVLGNQNLWDSRHGDNQARFGTSRGGPRGGRTLHLDAGPYGYHLNADIGPLAPFNHQPVPRWLYRLGNNSVLKGLGGASVGLALGIDAYDYLTAAPCDRGRILAGAAGGLVGSALLGGLAGSVWPGPGTILGAAAGGIAGGHLGGLLPGPTCSCVP